MRTIDILDSFLVYSLFCRFLHSAAWSSYFSVGTWICWLCSLKKYKCIFFVVLRKTDGRNLNVHPPIPAGAPARREEWVRERERWERSGSRAIVTGGQNKKIAQILSNRRTKLDFVHPLDEILWPRFKSFGQKMKLRNNLISSAGWKKFKFCLLGRRHRSSSGIPHIQSINP